MAMRFSCAICTDSLEKQFNPAPAPGQPLVPVPPGVNVITTPCGHVYHAYCIIRWMKGGQANSSSCPNCRKKITSKQCVPLFHDSYEVSILEGPDSQPSGANPEEIGRLKSKIAELTSNTEKLKAAHDDNEAMLQVYTTENQSLNNELLKEREKNEGWTMRYTEFKSWKSYGETKEVQCNKLQEELAKYKQIKAMLDGVRIESEHDMKQYKVTPESVRTLVELNNLLKREIDSVRQKSKDEQSEKEAQRVKILRLEAKIKELNNEKKEMESQMMSHVESLNSNLRKPLSTFPQSPKSSHLKNHESSSKTFRKRSSNEGNRTITISSSSDSDEGTVGVGLDLEVGVLTSLDGVRMNGAKLAKLGATASQKKTVTISPFSPPRFHSRIPGLGESARNAPDQGTRRRLEAAKAKPSTRRFLN